MNHSRFFKKFSIGLVLDTTLAEYEEFLQKYHPYIANIYFSLPMGDRFHARRRVAEQLTQQQSVDLFWQLLALIQRYEISLEVVFNTGGITEQDVLEGKQLLDSYGISVDLVGVVEPLYHTVKNAFPESETVYSFNNRGNGISALSRIRNRYDEFVIGRQDIRNKKLMEYIRTEKQARTVLLVNNGCSFVCGGCTELQNCHEAYYREARKHSPAMLYAMQSIMPFELHEELLPLDLIDRIKLSTRNSDIGYVIRCLESYLHGDEIKWLQQSAGNYYLWGRLAWHSEFYNSFDLQQIVQWKRKWYKYGVWEKTIPLTGAISVDLDFSHHHNAPCRQYMESLDKWLDRLCAKFPWEKGVCYLSPSDLYLAERAAILRENGWKIWLHLPKGFDQKQLPIIPCGILAEDIATASWAEQLDIPVALGSELASFKTDSLPPNLYTDGNGGSYGSGIFPNSLRQLYHQHCAAFAVIKMPPCGLQISYNEPMTLKAYISPSSFTSCVRKTIVENRICPILMPPQET